MPRFDSRLGCSTISFRHQPLPEALATIAGLGFAEIDLGALPGVCDHVPYVLDVAAVDDVARTVADPACRCGRSTATSATSTCRSPTDPAPPPRPSRHARRAGRRHRRAGARTALRGARPLSRSTRSTATSTGSPTNSRRPLTSRPARGVELWTESLHFHRLCCEHRASAAAHRPPRRPGRHRDGLQPHRRLRRRPGRLRRPVRAAHRRTSTSAMPCPATSTSRSATATSTSPAASRPSPTPVTPATSRSNSRLATSPTTNDPLRPPRPDT